MLLEHLTKEEAKMSTEDEKLDALATTNGLYKKRDQSDSKNEQAGIKRARYQNKKGQAKV